MDDNEEYLPEYNIHERSGLGLGTSVITTSFINFKSREGALVVNGAVVQRILHAQLPHLNLTQNDAANYLEDLKNVPLLQYKNAVGLLFGWLAFRRSYSFVFKFLKQHLSWPEDIEPLNWREAIRYARMWTMLYQSGLPPGSIRNA